VTADTSHRPWPLPSKPWAVAMRWHHLAFLHWPLDANIVRLLVPSELDVEVFEGHAWVGITPFGMTGVRPRWLPSLPWVSAFPELNVRTYVTVGGKRGVWFFSLDAGNPLAVRVARWAFGLPYYTARMSLTAMNGDIGFESIRTHHRAPSAGFRARYRPTGVPTRSRPGSLEHWLTERYCLYTMDRTGALYRAEIHHAGWPLQAGEADLNSNTMAQAAGIELPSVAPLVHFARRLDVVAWMPDRIFSEPRQSRRARDRSGSRQAM
jgi:uncharacterized protein YqjF (DUF2071 family)